MAAQQPLQGTELIDCAKANAKQGLSTAAFQCGYGDDTDNFMKNLQQACQNIGVDIQDLSDLITSSPISKGTLGIEIAPETANRF